MLGCRARARYRSDMTDVWVLTGGIGSGKTTIAETLGRLGAGTIDADRIGHAVLETGGLAFADVADRWPQTVIDGRIDRSTLAAIVFSDPGELRALETISHPAIAATISRQILDSDRSVVVVEVSVPKDLVGAGWDHTIVADLDDEERVRRLIDRGMDRRDVERRMANQPSRSGWRARGRWIIPTDGTREDVIARVERLWHDHVAPR